MKKLIYTLLLCFACSLGAAQAQHATMNKKQFREHQKEFIIKKVKLTPQEAEAFFPIYFELQDKKHELNKEAWINLRKGKQENLTESEYSRIVDQVVEARIAADQLELEYIQKYKKIISSQKIYLIQRAEMHFHRNIINCARQYKKGGKAPQKGQ